MDDINFDKIFNGSVTAVQGISDTIDAFSGKPNRRELVNPSLQQNQNTHQYVDHRTGAIINNGNPAIPQTPMVDYSNIGYEQQGYGNSNYMQFQRQIPSYGQSFNNTGMNPFHNNGYSNSLPAYAGNGFYDEAYGR